MSYVITIGREYGSGGRYVGQELAKKLNIKFYDSELINKVAEETGLCVEYIKDNDEKKDSFFAYVGLNESTSFLTASQRVSLAQFKTIQKLAEKNESFVIVGRCADYVLRDYKNLVSVFIMADEESKIERAVTFYGINKDKASEILKKMDKNRASYYNYFTDRKWGKASNYDICVSSSIGIKETVDVIEAFVKSKLKDQF